MKTIVVGDGRTLLCRDGLAVRKCAPIPTPDTLESEVVWGKRGIGQWTGANAHVAKSKVRRTGSR